MEFEKTVNDDFTVSYENSHVVISLKGQQDFRFKIPEETDGETHQEIYSRIVTNVRASVVRHWFYGKQTNRTTRHIVHDSEYDVSLMRWFIFNEPEDFTLGYTSSGDILLTFKMHTLHRMVNLKKCAWVERPAEIFEDPEWLLGTATFFPKYQMFYNGTMENPQQRFSLAYGFYADNLLDYYLSEDEIGLNGGRFSETQHVEYTDDTDVWKHTIIILMKNVPDIMDIIRRGSDRRWTCSRERAGRLLLYVQDDDVATLIKTLYAQT